MHPSIIPPPSDAALLAYLDGEGDPALIDHIQQCESCRVRIETLAATEKHLTARLFRLDCPSPLELGEFDMGFLTAIRSVEIGQHVGECPHCSHELAQLRVFNNTLIPATEPSLLDETVDRVKIIVARLLSDVQDGMQGFGALQPAPIGFRGEEDAPVIYEAEHIQIILEFTPDPANPERQMLIGLIMGDEDLESFAVQLWREGACVETIQVDAIGNFSFDNLLPAIYDLRLLRAELQITVDSLQLT